MIFFQDEETSGAKSTEEATQPSSLGTRSSGVKSAEEVDKEISKVTHDQERPTSTVKFSSHLEVADIPSRSQSSLGPSRLSLMDEHGKPSRTSITTGTTGNEGMVFGRDAVIEREKINEEARNTFAVMDLRYRDMIQDLIDLDNAFELGLLSGSRQEFEEKIQGMRIVKTPPTSAGDKSKVELHIKERSSAANVDKHDLDNVVDKPSEKQTEDSLENTGKTARDENSIPEDTDETVKDKSTGCKNDPSQTDVNGKADVMESSSVGSAKLRKEKSDIEIVVTDVSEEKKVDS